MTKDFLNVICVNIRSANANFDHLLLSLENDENYRYLDVIILTGTWHNTNNCNFNINGFQLYHSKVKKKPKLWYFVLSRYNIDSFVEI